MLNFVHNTFPKLLLAMLIILSAAVFVVPNQNKVQAQAGTNQICFNSSTGALQYPATGNVCPTGSTLASYPRDGLGVCVADGPSGKIASQPVMVNGAPKLDATGRRCLSSDTPAIDIGAFNAFTSIPKPPTTPTPPANGPPTTNPLPGANNSNTGSTTNTGTGGCETGFHKVGPLCVPNSPFGNNNSIGGETTIGGLAARIVRILLYFAGIVAVIMAIIGGYQVMTAGGNEAQATSGRKTLTNAIIGLVIVILSFIIIQAVISFVTK